jgi:hypothetical protein
MNSEPNKSCSNCGKEFAGKFCQECGQKDKDFEPSLRDWVHAVWDDFLFVDAKLINTSKALFQPGRYTRDWLDGRQARYVHPVRLYIFLSVIYGLMNTLFDTGGDFFGGFFDALLATEIESSTQIEFKTQIIQIVSIVTLPISVISAQLFDRRSKIVTSVFFAINLYSAFLILLIGLNLLTLITIELDSTFSNAVAAVLLMMSFVFVGLSAKQVYAISNMSAFFRSSLWILANFFLFVALAIGSLGFYQAHSEAEQKTPTYGQQE